MNRHNCTTKTPCRLIAPPHTHPTKQTLARLARLHARLKKAQLRVQVLKLQRDAVVAQVEATEAVAQGTLRYPEEVRGARWFLVLFSDGDGDDDERRSIHTNLSLDGSGRSFY